MWKEAVVAQFLSYYPGGTEKNHDKPVRIASLRAEI
jgi:hypothetical protein